MYRGRHEKVQTYASIALNASQTHIFEIPTTYASSSLSQHLAQHKMHRIPILINKERIHFRARRKKNNRERVRESEYRTQKGMKRSRDSMKF